jgi:hypothetical protein
MWITFPIGLPSLSSIVDPPSLKGTNKNQHRGIHHKDLKTGRLRPSRNDETEKSPEPNLLEAFPIDSI